jgi:hypothetical protein
VTRYIRECQVLGADQLHWRAFEHRIVLLTHESCILNRLGSNIMDVGIRTNNPNVIWMRLEGVECDVCSPCQCNSFLRRTWLRVQRGPTLANQESNPNAGHVKPIQKPLDVISDQPALVRLFPLEDPPRDGRNGRVMPPFDLIEGSCEPFVIVVHLGRPLDAGWVPIVPSIHRNAQARLVVCRNCAV